MYSFGQSPLQKDLTEEKPYKKTKLNIASKKKNVKGIDFYPSFFRLDQVSPQLILHPL